MKSTKQKSRRINKIIKTKGGDSFRTQVINGKLVLTHEILEYVDNDPSFILHLVTYDLNVQDKAKLRKYNYFFEQDLFDDSIRYYLNELLLSDNLEMYFKRLQRMGILKRLIPELDTCRKIKQLNKFHRFDVFEHCVHTAEYLEKDLALRWAGLLHDVGKAKTYKVINGKITFHKHNRQGAIIARKTLERLGYNSTFVRKVAKLVDLHMYYYTSSWTDKAVKKFIKSADINEKNINKLGSLPLFKLRAADRIGSGLKHTAVTELQKKFQDRIKRVFYEQY